MPSTKVAEKVAIAAGFLVDSPPGEFHEVLNDIRVLVNADADLQAGIKTAVRSYNTDQFICATVDGKSVLVSKFAEVDEGAAFVDNHLKIKFEFDHVRQTASNPKPYTPSGPNEALRSSIDDAVHAYVADHYPQGVCAVYADAKAITIVIVANRYKPTNYWNGRWRAQWTYTVGDGKLGGLLRSQVHYYEDGNVQLNSDKPVPPTALPTTSAATADPANISARIVATIMQVENEYQGALNESYAELSDTTFKGLRRALPVTRNKVDWSKIINYKLGAALLQQQQQQ